MKMTSEENSIYDQLQILRELLEEKRSDIAEILEAILDGQDWDTDWVEHRIITAELPDGKRLLYDTLTTEIMFEGENGKFETAKNHNYED